MKKIVSIGNLAVGIILGITISFSPQIYGASAILLGKDVDKQMEVKLNDKVIGQAAVIEGTSYIPVRAFANEYDLGIAVTSSTISLTSPSSEENTKIAKDQEDSTNKPALINDLNKKIKISKEKVAEYEESVAFCEKRVSETKANVDYLASTGKGDQAQKDMTQKSYESAVAGLDTAKATLAAEKAKLADLEAQLAALQ